MTDKHARRSAQNTKSMNDFVTRKEVFTLLRNVGLLDEKGEPAWLPIDRYRQRSIHAIEAELAALDAAMSHKPTPWYRRLWARLRRQG